jgi:DNA-binding NarL/FixJ family response regulator
MDATRVLIVDDHPLVRSGIQALLASVPDMAVAGTAGTGEEAVTMAEQLQPDIVLMDLHMPGMNGIEATRRILQVSPRIGILVLTMLDDDDSVFAAMRAGARGYLLQYFANMRPVLPRSVFPELTEREREILGLIGVGRTNAEIAGELVLSPKTVSNHVSNIFNKLQVVDRAQAALRAREVGLGSEWTR